MARPARLELATPCLEAVRSILPNLARGVANRTESASWANFPQAAFSFICLRFPHICVCFPHFALHFRDSRLSPPPRCKLRAALNCLARGRPFSPILLPTHSHANSYATL